MIDLSVIIVNWNTKEYLLRCLESICSTGERGSWDLVVVDNGSQDGSVEEVKKRSPRVKLIENKANIGFSKATNRGMRISSGKYLLLLNPDTQIKEGSAERLACFMDGHPEAGIAGAQLLNEDGSKQNSIANFPSLATELLNKSFLRFFFPERFPGKVRNYNEPIEVDSVIGAAMIVRREAMDRVGFLDEDYFLFFEETDWCFRMKRAGWKIYHVPQAEVYHFQGKSADTEKKKAKVEYYRSRYHFFKKNRGTLQWVILHIGLMIRLCIEMILMSTACFLTLWTIKGWRRKLCIYAYLLWWHIRGCRRGMGLEEIK